jgi:transposase-like protein
MKEAYYTILGVRADRTREVLAVVNFPTESSSAWKEVFTQLKQKGVKKIDLVVCDGLQGIDNSIVSEFSQAEVQLCTVHLQRNVQKYVKPKDKEEVAADYKEVFEMDNKNDSQEEAWQRWKGFCSKWERKYSSIGKMGCNERYKLYFTCFNYDYRMRRMIYTTNWIERLNRDYKRVTKMRGSLPNPEAALLLLGRVAMTRKAYDRKVPKLNYETIKFNWED